MKSTVMPMQLRLGVKFIGVSLTRYFFYYSRLELLMVMGKCIIRMGLFLSVSLLMGYHMGLLIMFGLMVVFIRVMWRMAKLLIPLATMFAMITHTKDQ